MALVIRAPATKYNIVVGYPSCEGLDVTQRYCLEAASHSVEAQTAADAAALPLSTINAACERLIERGLLKLKGSTLTLTASGKASRQCIQVLEDLKASPRIAYWIAEAAVWVLGAPSLQVGEAPGQPAPSKELDIVKKHLMKALAVDLKVPKKGPTPAVTLEDHGGTLLDIAISANIAKVALTRGEKVLDGFQRKVRPKASR